MNGPRPDEEAIQARIGELENQNAHHAPRASAEWLEYQAMHDALGIDLPEIINEVGGVWNDHTQAYETVVQTVRQKAHDMVQRRIRSAEFSREYSHYVAAVRTGNNARGLHSGVHDPQADHSADVGSEHSGDDSQRLGSDLRGDPAGADGPAEPGS